MIAIIAPNATHPSGGVAVAAHWVRLLIQHGHDAMFITPNGDPSPFWLNFKVPSGSYQDVKDLLGNKRVDVWFDCAVEFKTFSMQKYFFAQDCCQLEHITNAKGIEAVSRDYLSLFESTKLITLNSHGHWYYLYRYGIQSKIVNNFVDSRLFSQALRKIPGKICLINHRDHFNPEIPPMLEKLGYQVVIAHGSQEEIAYIMGESEYFISDVRGRSDGYELSEGMPMPIMEAMASGCITLCRDTNGVKEFAMDKVNALFYKEIQEIPRLLKEATVSRETSIANLAWQTIHHKFTEENTWKQMKEALELN